MTSNHGTNRADYYSKKPIYFLSGCSIGVNQLMSVNSFESICSALKFTTPPPSAHFYRYKCYEVRHMIFVQIGHTQIIFIPSRISRLDEPMSARMNKFTIPVFFFCPSQASSRGYNEYIAPYAAVKVLYHVRLGYIVEGKGIIRISTGERPKFETIPNMNTVGLILGLTGALRSTGMAAITYG